MTMPSPASLPPGFRFHPTDEELILHYLRNRAASAPCPVAIIAEVDIYKFDPWQLPAKSIFGDREWYFFSPRDRKYPNGSRPNRAAASGYWKATGTDKPIRGSGQGSNKNIGVKKALVFYKGRPPKGMKTNWIMHEYRLAEAQSSNSYKPMQLRDSSMRLDDWVLCRIYKKSTCYSALPAMLEHDQDESDSEDIYRSTSPDIPPQSAVRLPKSSSTMEFLEDYSALSNLFDGLPEVTIPGHVSLFSQPYSNQFLVNSSESNGSFVQQQQLAQTGSPASLAESSITRPRAANNYLEEGNGASNSNQIDGLRSNLMNQPTSRASRYW